jgi:hypothetical protein
MIEPDLDQLIPPAAPTPDVGPSPIITPDMSQLVPPAQNAETQGIIPDLSQLEAPQLPDMKKDSGDTTMSARDIEMIVAKTGADPEKVKEIGRWARLPPEEDVATVGGKIVQAAREVPSSIASSLSGGMSEGIAKAFEDPKAAAAWDEIIALRNDRRSWEEATNEALRQLPSQFTAGSKILGAVSKAPVIGGAVSKLYNAAPSVAKTMATSGISSGIGGFVTGREGERVQNAALSAALGATVGLGMEAALAVPGAARYVKDKAGKLRELITPGEGPRGGRTSPTTPTAPAMPPMVQGAVEAAEASYVKNAAVEDKITTMLLDPQIRAAGSEAEAAELIHKFLGPDLDAVAELGKLPSKGEADDMVTQIMKGTSGLDDPTVEKLSRVMQLYNDSSRALARVVRPDKFGNMQTAIEREGLPYVTDVVKNLRKADYYRKALSNVLPDSTNVIDEVLAKVSDARLVTDDIDAATGGVLGVTPLLDRLSENVNLSKLKIVDRLGAVRGVLEKHDQRAIGPEQMDLIYNYLDRGRDKDWDALTPAAREMATDVKAVLSDLRDDVVASGINIPKRQAYVPHVQVSEPESLLRIRSRLERAENDTAAIMRDKELVLGMKYMTGRQGTETTPELVEKMAQEMWQPLKELRSARTARTSTTSARALMSRAEEDIPTFLLEKDLNKLIGSWVQNTYRHAAVRGELAGLTAVADALRGSSPLYARYLDNLAADVIGVPRTGTLASWAKGMADNMYIWAHTARNAEKSPAKRLFYEQVAELDNTLRTASSNIYSYYLGASPGKAGRNLVAGYTMTAPSMSPSHQLDANRRVTEGYAKFANDRFSAGGADKVNGTLEREGLTATDKVFEAEREFRDGISRSPLGKMGADFVESSSKLAMYMYAGADNATRYMAREVARGVVDDAVKGDVAARAHLAATPTGVRRAIGKAMGEGDVAGAKTIYTRYLNGHTLFNYNKAQMNEFSRSAGWMFSMFSKWPAYVAGDVARQVRATVKGERDGGQGVKRLMSKYMIPYLTLQQIENTDLMAELREENPTLSRLTGGKLQDAAPLGSIIGLGDKAVPPILAPLGKAGESLKQGTAAPMAKQFIDTAISMAPAGWIVRLLNEDVPGVWGELVEGSTGEPVLPLSGRGAVEATRDIADDLIE